MEQLRQARGLDHPVDALVGLPDDVLANVDYIADRKDAIVQERLHALARLQQQAEALQPLREQA
eukprot:8244126-Lingulodinium_polyedra.AAC.1